LHIWFLRIEMHRCIHVSRRNWAMHRCVQEKMSYAQLRPKELRCTDARREKVSIDAQMRLEYYMIVWYTSIIRWPIYLCERVSVADRTAAGEIERRGRDLSLRRQRIKMRPRPMDWSGGVVLRPRGAQDCIGALMRGGGLDGVGQTRGRWRAARGGGVQACKVWDRR
jgi:hypothetical protein